MMGLFVANKWSAVSQHFADRLTGLPHSPETIAYVVGVLGKRRWDDKDLMTDRSLVVVFQDALIKRDFAEFQRIGDWVLFADTVFPDHLNGVRDFAENVGRLSYYECFRLMGQSWRVYEELADELPTLVARVRNRLV